MNHQDTHHSSSPLVAILASLTDIDVFVLATQMGAGWPASQHMSHREQFVLERQMGTAAHSAWHGHIFKAKDTAVILFSHLTDGQAPRTFQELLGFVATDEQWLAETLLIECKLDAVATLTCTDEKQARDGAISAGEAFGFNVIQAKAS
jgi:hypothetical protein